MSAFPCRYAVVLAAVNIEAAARVAVVRVQQKVIEGTVCGSPDTLHVLRW